MFVSCGGGNGALFACCGDDDACDTTLKGVVAVVVVEMNGSTARWPLASAFRSCRLLLLAACLLIVDAALSELEMLPDVVGVEDLVSE